MNLDKIELPDFIIANLFTDNLVISTDLKQNVKSANEVKPAVVVTLLQADNNSDVVIPANVSSHPSVKQSENLVTQEKPFVFTPPKDLYLGDNLKNVTILVKDNEAVYIRQEWLQFLTNILGACKLNIGDVAIINQAHNQINFSDIISATAPRYLIMFEVDSKDINLSFIVPNYQVQNYNNTTFLLAPSLSVMLGNTDEVKVEKTKLWMSLKKMFNI